MLIIPVLADAFLPSSLFSCRLKGLELSVSSPSSTYSALYQLSGSAALIIIWPHLFGWLGELWFSFCMLCGQHKVRVSIHLAALNILYLGKVLLWQQTSSNAVLPEVALSWTEAIFFFTNHCQLTLKAGKRWHLHFHYRPLIKSTHTDTREQHVKRSPWQGDKPVITLNFCKNKSQTTWNVLSI